MVQVKFLVIFFSLTSAVELQTRMYRGQDRDKAPARQPAQQPAQQPALQVMAPIVPARPNIVPQIHLRETNGRRRLPDDTGAHLRASRAVAERAEINQARREDREYILQKYNGLMKTARTTGMARGQTKYDTILSMEPPKVRRGRVYMVEELQNRLNQ